MARVFHALICAIAAVGVVPAASAAPPVPPFAESPVGEAPCPEGMARSATVTTASFESDLPEPSWNEGWYRITTSAPDGRHVARSLLSGSSSDPSDYFFMAPSRASGTTYLSLASRGNQATSAAIVASNSVGRSIPASSSWTGHTVDITRAAAEEGGWLTTFFEHRYTSGVERIWDVDNVQIYGCATAPTTRITGSDRYAVSASIADGFPAGTSTVYVARGDNFPDALSAVPVAASASAPILLVRPDDIPGSVRTALERLRPKWIVVLGGTSSVSPAVYADLARLPSEGIRRVSGPDRYAVSAALSAEQYPGGSSEVLIASGEVFPDALSAAPLAAGTGIAAKANASAVPLLLTRAGEIPGAIATELTRLAPTRITIVGGPATVSPEVEADLERLTGATVDRISGSDRYDVSAAVAGRWSASGVETTYLSTGADYPDAIIGAALAGSGNEPLLLTRGHGLPSEIRDRLEWFDEESGTVVGGPNSVASIVRDQYGRTLR